MVQVGPVGYVEHVDAEQLADLEVAVTGATCKTLIADTLNRRYGEASPFGPAGHVRRGRCATSLNFQIPWEIRP
jgi:hypothetical protein